MLSASLLLTTAIVPAKAAIISTGAACSLVQAIEAANTNAAVGGCPAGAVGRDRIILTGDVILSAANNGLNGLPVILEDLTITTSGPTRSIQRSTAIGIPNFRFLEIGSAAVAPRVTVSNIIMWNGRVNGPVNIFGLGGVGGGCILLNNGALKIEDSALQECVAEGDDSTAGNAGNAFGGAIYAGGGSLEIKSSTFGLNEAHGGSASAAGDRPGSATGGAIDAVGLTSLTIEDSVIDSNFATGGAGVDLAGAANGGGLAFTGSAGVSSGSFTGTTFSGNAVTSGVAASGNGSIGFGGALAATDVTLAISDVDFANNVANGADSVAGHGGSAAGGAIHAHGGTLDFDGGSIVGNRATGGTGSVPSSDGNARGGGMFLLDTNATLDRVTVETNELSGSYPTGAGLVVSNADAVDNTVLITHSTLASNTVTATSGFAQGGAIYQAGDIVTLRNTRVSGNAAEDGAGLYQENGVATIRLSTLDANAASRYGGALAVDKGLFFDHSVALINATISGNAATLAGGGIYMTGSSLAPAATNVSLVNTLVTDNTNGGVSLVEGLTQPTLDVGNSIIGAQASGDDCVVTGTVILTSEGGNLENGTSCAFTATSDQQSVADLGLSPLGDHGGETPVHDVLAGSPAIDAGRQRMCNHDANKKDQRGLARFYDGNGDREFACDSGPAEYQGLLANPGFETPLDSVADWTLVASGGGDGRVRLATAPSGKFALVFRANSALEVLGQSRPISGAAGDAYTLTMLGEGTGLTVGEAMTVTLEALSAGTAVDTKTCTITFDTATFSGAPAACTLDTTAAYDTVKTTIGWENVTTGSVTLDAISLTQG